MAKKVAILNTKEGVAKTTTAIVLAGILSENEDNKVLIVDGDAKGNSLFAFGENPELLNDTLYDVIVGGLPASQVIYEYSNNLHILPSNDDLDFLDQDVWTNQSRYPVPFRLLQRALWEHIEPKYTHIIFDASSNMNLMSMNILAYADSVVVPFELNETALKGLTKMVQKIQDFKESRNHQLTISALLPVKVDFGSEENLSILEDIQQFADEHHLILYKKGIQKEPVLDTSLPMFGSSVNQKKHAQNMAKNYYEFTHTLRDREIF